MLLDNIMICAIVIILLLLCYILITYFMQSTDNTLTENYVVSESYFEGSQKTTASETIGDILINWQIIKFDNESNNIHNMFSVSFFRNKNCDDDTFRNKYSDPMKNIIANFSTCCTTTYKLRIYIDKSVLQLLDEITKDVSPDIKKLIEIYIYDIPSFYDDIDHHMSVIGTLFRLFPLFDLKLHSEEIVSIIDIDYNIPDMNTITKYFDEHKVGVLYRAFYWYIRYPRTNCCKEYIKTTYPVMLGSLHINKKYGSDMPSRIIHDVFSLLYSKKNYNEITNIKHKCGINVYDYGIDEYIANRYFMPYYTSNTNIMACLENHEIRSAMGTIIDDLFRSFFSTKNLNHLDILIAIINLINIHNNINENVRLIIYSMKSLDDFFKYGGTKIELLKQLDGKKNEIDDIINKINNMDITTSVVCTSDNNCIDQLFKKVSVHVLEHLSHGDSLRGMIYDKNTGQISSVWMPDFIL